MANLLFLQKTANGNVPDKRFAFGENWTRFLSVLNEERIAEAERSLRRMLELNSLEGRTFVDIGSGSGLFSLAARRLGAVVRSFDLDPQSVACTRELRRRYFPDDSSWHVEQGSVLDQNYLASLGQFDIVYSWGVLHHTGAMWKALENLERLVAPGGKLFIAIYNDLGWVSQLWRLIKRTYCSLPNNLRFLILWPCVVRAWGPTMVRDLVMFQPMHAWRSYYQKRGMSPWYDVVDWAGGYPYEVAKPEDIFHFYRQRGFTLSRLKTCGRGKGCNEYVFKRTDRNS